MTIPGHSQPVKCVSWVEHGMYYLLIYLILVGSAVAQW